MASKVWTVVVLAILVFFVVIVVREVNAHRAGADLRGPRGLAHPFVRAAHVRWQGGHGRGREYHRDAALLHEEEARRDRRRAAPETKGVISGATQLPRLHVLEVQYRLPRDNQPHIAGLLLRERGSPAVERLGAPGDLVEVALGITELDDQR